MINEPEFYATAKLLEGDAPVCDIKDIKILPKQLVETRHHFLGEDSERVQDMVTPPGEASFTCIIEDDKKLSLHKECIYNIQLNHEKIMIIVKRIGKTMNGLCKVSSTIMG